MEYPELLHPLLARFANEAPKVIECGEGWWKLLSACDTQLEKIDPDYTIFQIKEKFGGLRYYYSPSNPDNGRAMDGVIAEFERICWMTCEVTGRHGYLMSNTPNGLGRRRVLNEDYLKEGWTRIQNSAIGSA